MAARSAAELLPRAFAELTIDDLATIIAAVGEERESLFFERKQSITSASLAKSCAAFANTYGGLLIVGVADDSDELVGIDLVAEPQVWVKDVLRGHVLPLPPFRARSLPLPDSTARGVLLVLLEESSTTPHLLTRTGAIYVRNPGSSDPVPINDQKRLLDLTERGKASLAKAEARITEIGRQASFDLLPATQQTELLLLRPTGIAPWFAALLFDSPSPEPLHEALASMDALTPDRVYEKPESFWGQHEVALTRAVRGGAGLPLTLHAVKVWRDGTILLLLGALEVPRQQLRGDGVVDRLGSLVEIGRELVLSLGGHGDARVGYGVRPNPQYLTWRGEQTAADIFIQEWTSLDPSEDPGLVDRIARELARAMGLPPEGPDS